MNKIELKINLSKLPTTFSYLDKMYTTDERREKYLLQQKERGFDNSELWGLDQTIIEFTLPRLKIFKDYTQSFPFTEDNLTYESWQEIIQKMIDAMEKYIDSSDDLYGNHTTEGMQLFFKYFNHLWS